MKYTQAFVLAFALIFSVHAFGDENATGAKASGDVGNSAVPSDFFADALAKAKADDAMGTQRLVDVKSSELTPSLSLSSSYKYTSNPTKRSKI